MLTTEWPFRRVVKLELLFFMVLACVLLKDVDGSRFGNGLLSPKAEETVRIFKLEQSVRDSLLKMISAYDPVRLTQEFWSPSEDQSRPDEPRILQPGSSLQGVSDE